MYTWFRYCRSSEEGKNLYRELAKKYHPDNGGTGEELKEIILEFKRWYSEFKDIHEGKDGTTYASSKKTATTAEEFVEIINNLSTIPNIEVEMCGDWLWITGNSYPYKDTLKQFGCRWSVGKKKWYWTTAPYTRKTTHPSMDTIRNLYGSENIELNRRAELE